MAHSGDLVASRAAESGAVSERTEPKSRALSTIAGYFNVVAVLNGVSWLGLLAMVYAGPLRTSPLVSVMPWRTVGMIATVAMQLRVGHLLHRRSREGGVWAIAALAPSLISRLVHQPTPLSGYSIIISVVGLGLVALVWKELE
jgi:hypothetical protein